MTKEIIRHLRDICAKETCTMTEAFNILQVDIEKELRNDAAEKAFNEKFKVCKTN